MWEVHDAGDPIPRGGRKRVTNNEVKVVDDVGDDDATMRRKNEGANEAETSKLFFI